MIAHIRVTELHSQGNSMSRSQANTSFHGKSVFSIRTMLLSAIGALSLLAIAAFGWNGVGAWQRYEAAWHAQEFDAGVNKFIAGLFEVLMERLYTNNGL